MRTLHRAQETVSASSRVFGARAALPSGVVRRSSIRLTGDEWRDLARTELSTSYERSFARSVGRPAGRSSETYGEKTSGGGAGHS